MSYKQMHINTFCKKTNPNMFIPSANISFKKNLSH